ncbi:MAG: 50S ribosomal protein L11 methyltransferase [Pseudomonadota bacterium]
MSGTWKITALAPRALVEAALLAHEDAADWDYEVTLSGGMLVPEGTAGADPDAWRLEAWYSRKPTGADQAALAALFANGAPPLTVEQLPDADWLTISQQDVQPIRAGRFNVHTPDFPPLLSPGIRDFEIPASLAFGTGHHGTTAGCLTMLGHMRAQGLVIRNLADIGTGTGLLAFASLHLWPRALATASDIDHVCAGVVLENAARNGVPLGGGPGQLVMVIADGMADPLLDARGPYDLIVANILAGPLIALAPDFADHLLPGGHLLLSGLLATQEDQVRAACRRAGMRLAARLVVEEWSVLWLRKRARPALRG